MRGRTSIRGPGRARAVDQGAGYGLGFDLVGITTLGPASTAPRIRRWLARGYAGEMSYMARTAEKRRDSRLPLEGATTRDRRRA